MTQGQSRELFKADLHCHTRHSGPAKHLRFLHCRDCYSKPVDVYRTAKQRGMHLVTLTDHDSIDGCLELRDRLGELSDFIMGEEVSAYFPEFRHEAHIAVYGLHEAQHREIQKLRANGEELVAYLRREKLLFVLNHFFHGFSDGALVRRFIARMAELFDVFEVRNGSQQREHNQFIVELLKDFRNGSRRSIGIVGGSDSHTLRRLGRTYTASPARTREGFLADVRAGRAQAFGPHSNHLSLAAEIYGVVLRHYPAVLSGANGDLPALPRLKAIVLTFLAAPFLFTPYVIALRHSKTERERVRRFSRLWFEGASSPA